MIIILSLVALFVLYVYVSHGFYRYRAHQLHLKTGALLAAVDIFFLPGGLIGMWLTIKAEKLLRR